MNSKVRKNQNKVSFSFRGFISYFLCLRCVCAYFSFSHFLSLFLSGVFYISLVSLFLCLAIKKKNTRYARTFYSKDKQIFSLFAESKRRRERIFERKRQISTEENHSNDESITKPVWHLLFTLLFFAFNS